MNVIADLIRWIITYAVENGFWHFIATVIIVCAICRITTLFKVNVSCPTRTKKKDDDE